MEPRGCYSPIFDIKNNMPLVDGNKIQGNLKVQFVILKYLNCDDEESNRKEDKGFGW